MLKIKNSKKSIFIILYLLTAFHLPAQSTVQCIFGDSTAAKSAEVKAATSQKKITVVGLGVSHDAAEKQAITDAVRQAVGAYIDSDTLVQNEEVVRDRILSVSNGFVKEYKPTASARKRDDGLYEITIIATIESNQVVQALKEINLISSEIAGQNLWAEASTKLKNSNDSLEFLNEKLPDFIKSLIKLDLLDESGKITKSINPVIQTQNGDQVTATWFVKLSVDQKTYFKSFAPILVKCMQNITGKPGKKFQLSKPVRAEYPSHQNWDAHNKFGPIDKNIYKPVPFKTTFYDFEKNNPIKSGCIFVVEKASANLDFLEGIQFPKGEYESILSSENEISWSVSIELYDENGEFLARGSTPIVEPFTIKNANFNNGVWRDHSEQPKGALVQVGPFICTNYYRQAVIGVDPVVPVSLEIPLEAMKSVKKIKFKMELPAEMKLVIQPAKES